MHGFKSIIAMLLDNKADVEMTNSFGETALDLASKGGHTDCIALLSQSQVDPGSVREGSRWEPRGQNSVEDEISQLFATRPDRS